MNRSNWRGLMRCSISSHATVKVLGVAGLLISLLSHASSVFAGELATSPVQDPTQPRTVASDSLIARESAFASRAIHWTSASMLSDGGVLLVTTKTDRPDQTTTKRI